MDLEPEKFFVGVIDFFSILLPGGLVTYLFKDAVGPKILGCGYCHLQGAEGWVVFLFSSYLLGHFLFFIGSFLDDWAYDPLRQMTDKREISRILAGRKLSPRALRWLAQLCFKKGADAAVDRVVPIKQKYLNRIDAPGAVNAFQWCKARLTDHPAALATVNRFEADSKFFRSFVPVMLVMLGAALYHGQWWVATGSLAAMGLAFVCYLKQRFKSTQQAYWHVLTMEASGEPTPPNGKPASSTTSPVLETHAGGVVFRKRRNRVDYLLVQAKDDANDWVLPKGHIEPGEDPRRCAIREVKEETGVWARISKELKVSQYMLGDRPIRVRFYLMEAIEDGKPEDRGREHKWLPLDKAQHLTRHPKIYELLRFAEQNRAVT